LLRFGNEFGTLSIASLCTYEDKIRVTLEIMLSRYKSSKGYNLYLHTMYAKSWSSIQFFVTDMTFEVFCLLMLNEDLLILELTVAIPFEEQCQGNLRNKV